MFVLQGGAHLTPRPSVVCHSAYGLIADDYPSFRAAAQLRLAAPAEPLEPLARLGVEPVADTASRALLLDLLVTGRLELGKESA